MALSFSILDVRPRSDGSKEVIAKVTGDTSYPSGGYQLTPANFGLNTFKPQQFSAGFVYPVILGGGVASGKAVASIFDVDTAGKYHMYAPAATTPFAVEVTATTNVSAVVQIMEAVGW